MTTGFNNLKVKETAVLVGIITEQQDELTTIDYLDELSFLVETAGATTSRYFTQKLEHSNPRTFIGSGKLKLIADYIEANAIDMVVFDDELSATQIRNIEHHFSCKILDRNNLILDIFAKHAQSAHARAQVALAQHQYLLPRLAGMWTHLERQKGGVGLRGPGETEIETDRRIIRNKISALKSQLKKIDKQKTTQRGNRGNMVRVALVGYTNAGKSTIMNLLSHSNIFAEDKLFATLDTTVRKVVIENIPFLLSDTVGFIRKLPHQLIESFKSTLDEVREADLLIHVVDISHREFESHYEVVNKTLNEIDVINKPIIVVFNKIDNYTFLPRDPNELINPDEATITLEMLQQSWMARLTEIPCLFISATDKTNIPSLKTAIYSIVQNLHVKRYPNYLQ